MGIRLFDKLVIRYCNRNKLVVIKLLIVKGIIIKREYKVLSNIE